MGGCKIAFTSVAETYPILLCLSGRLAVVVGGGAVAVRKAGGLLAAGAAVRCVAPHVHEKMPENVELVREMFESRHLEGAMLVFAATDVVEVNDAVVREARRRGILVGRADASEAEAGDFTVPALWHDGEVTIGVSAGGSPALAAVIRDRVGERMDRALVRMAETMKQLRPMIKARVADTGRRQEIFRALAGERAIAINEHGGMAAVQEWIEREWISSPSSEASSSS